MSMTMFNVRSIRLRHRWLREWDSVSRHQVPIALVVANTPKIIDSKNNPTTSELMRLTSPAGKKQVSMREGTVCNSPR